MQMENKIDPTKSVLPSPHQVDIEKLKNEIRVALEHLSPREQKILTMRFGLEDSISRTLEEVGREVGLTRERIRQIEAKALCRIKYERYEKKDNSTA